MRTWDQFTDDVIARLSPDPKSPEERYVVNPAGDRWVVIDTVTGFYAGEPSGFTTKATAKTFRAGLIAQAKEAANG